MTTTTEKDVLGKAIGRISSGIYIVTVRNEGENQGMLASWVMQAGFEPPTITVAVQKDRDILKSIEDASRFVTNVLSDSNSNLMGRFGKYRPDQFEGLSLFEHDYGPVLQDTVAYLACELKDKWTAGDHVILLGQVIDGDILNPDLQPWTHLRKNGFSY